MNFSSYRSRALLACRLSFSLTTLTAGSNPSSSSSSLPALLRNPEVNGFRYRESQETQNKKKKRKKEFTVSMIESRDNFRKSINPQVVSLWTAEDTHYLLERLELLLAPPWLDDVGVLAEAPPSDEIRPSRPNFPSLLSGASFRFSRINKTREKLIDFSLELPKDCQIYLNW